MTYFPLFTQLLHIHQTKEHIKRTEILNKNQYYYFFENIYLTTRAIIILIHLFRVFLVTSCNLQQRNTQTKVLKITKKFRLYFLQFRFYQQKTTHTYKRTFFKICFNDEKNIHERKKQILYIFYFPPKNRTNYPICNISETHPP